ncbi:unnamed protein product [Linum trigynum]|uniref:Uncharacterized protein n=1 Tax=Linum trigynum TaxID=586398 RepID=A0AAV2FPZ4_9ROSI
MIWRLRARQTEETTNGGNVAKSASLLVGVFVGCRFSGIPGIWGREPGLLLVEGGAVSREARSEMGLGGGGDWF